MAGQDASGVLPTVSLPAEIGRAPELPLEQAHPSWNGTAGSGPPQRQVASDRRLSGVAFSRESQQQASSAVPEGAGQEIGPGLVPTRQGPNGSTGGEEGLTALLRPSVMNSTTRAQTLATQRFLLPKGAFIDCTLETAIDSTLPGMTTCVTATDTFGVDGKVVLLERGSKLVGETRGQVQSGAARVFVLWTQARTPTGVLVPLNSPGTDELGRSGLPGEVNRHFWDRFGAAMLISVIDGAVQAAAQSSTRGGGAIIFNPSTAQDALTEVLKGTINIAPTVVKHQGDRIQILVARDLDFRPVYELRSTGF
jgi:type IV secretion system protein VirB10